MITSLHLLRGAIATYSYLLAIVALENYGMNADRVSMPPD